MKFQFRPRIRILKPGAPLHPRSRPPTSSPVAIPFWQQQRSSHVLATDRYPRRLHLSKFAQINNSSRLFQIPQRELSSLQSPNIVSMATDRDTLPANVKPSHYDISLYDLELGGAWSYQGTVNINLKIAESTNQILLNVHQVQIKEAKFQNQAAKDIQYNEKQHRAIISFSEPLAPATDAVLTLKFSGTMNNSMAGFYRSKYKPTVPAAKSVPRDSEYHYMLSTQFESCDARRAFPCFDEPNLKATFDFEIEIPDDQTALSNMPVKATKQGSKAGMKVVSFERSPKMSTYLLAWAFGDFEYVEDFTKRKYNGKNLPVRVYTTRGLSHQGKFALENAHKVIDLFSEIFDIDYPLPKSDLLAVHEFSHGAMENWGLVTYRTTAVLFDDEKSDEKYKNRVAYVVAHELAHQWFGNLVTMDWWNELWLNEGFATWVGWLAIEELHPTWNVWGQFVTESAQTAFGLDSLRGSHPIEVPVRDALEVDQIFDSISYLKGSSCIRMLAAHIGNETFLKGVSNYLKAHAYGNATTNDLWSALSEASGKDITSFMDNWIRKIGFPVVTVAEEPGQLGIRQSRFLSSGDAKPEEDQTIWWVPLDLKTGSQATSSKALSLASKEETLRDIDTTFYKLNADQTGFYRTNYPPARLAALGTQKDRLSIEDKIGLIGDAGALAISGHGTTPALLAFLEECQSETNKLVWSEIVSSLGAIRSIFADNAKVSSALKAFTLKLVSPAAEKIGWDFPKGEDYLTSQLRALLIGVAGLAGHKGIVAEAQRRFEAYMSGADRDAIHPNLRSAVFRIGVSEGGDAAYEAVKREYLSTTSVDGKEIALQALGRGQTPALARDYFDFLFSDRVAGQDVHTGALALAANGRTRRALWECVRTDWDRVFAKLSGNMVVLDRFVRVSLNKFADREVGREIDEFFAKKDNRGYDRSLGVVRDTIATNAGYSERDEALILEWLGARGYV